MGAVEEALQGIQRAALINLKRAYIIVGERQIGLSRSGRLKRFIGHAQSLE